jgi:hypothetical protein
MSTDTSTIVIPPAPLFDEARLAIAGFLARYFGATRTSYATVQPSRLIGSSDEPQGRRRGDHGNGRSR